MSARELKEKGNGYFGGRNYGDAVECYTRAIQLDPSTPTYYTNRALCHLHTKQTGKAVADCRKALELDFKLVKAHFFLGRALLSEGHFDESVKSLVRAHELGTAQKLHFGDDISAVLRQAKQECFRVNEEVRIAKEFLLQDYVTRLIDEDMHRRLANLEVKEGTSDAKEGVDEVKETVDEGEEDEAREAIKIECNDYSTQFNDMLAQVDERRRMREVPDFMCGRISFDVLHDPVITPSGITYDRKAIMEHLQRVGHFDPVTRAPLAAEQLIPNLALKEAVEHFIRDNPWAVDY